MTDATIMTPNSKFDAQQDMPDDTRVERAMTAFAKDFGLTAAVYMEACIHCGACAKACHFYTATEDPKYTPILKLEPFKQAYKREAGPLAFVMKAFGLKPAVSSDELRDWQELLYDSCTMCGRCTQICPMSIDIASLVRQARHGMAAAGLAPTELYDHAREQSDEHGAPKLAAEEFSARVRALGAEHGVEIHIDKPSAEVMLCTSTTELDTYPDALIATARILNRMGLDWTYVSDGWETSNYGIVSGNEDWQRAASARLVAAADRIGATTMVLPECGHDYQAMRWEAANEMGRPLVRRALDDDMLEQLEELLITADMGVETAVRVTTNMAEGRMGQRLSSREIKEVLAGEIARIMEPVARPMPLYAKRPQVVLVVGVNGSGKTTTIGKLASQFKAAGKSVVIAAGDTFRAAAVEQLQVWGDRAGVPVMTAPEGSDPASLAFESMTKAEAEGADLLMIDTAGRLQNRADLMEELAKIVRVIRKKDASAPHNTLLVLDATTGQNALSQVETFQKLADVSGLVMTKLDGTARGGVLVALADRFGLPIHAIGVGEQLDDLAPFDPEEFAAALTGLETE